jgi:hypothetical protein
MSRPQHLSCPNTAEGIRRINEEQAYYDQDPQGYERQQAEAFERRQEEEYEMQKEMDRWSTREEEQAFEDYIEAGAKQQYEKVEQKDDIKPEDLPF